MKKPTETKNEPDSAEEVDTSNSVPAPLSHEQMLMHMRLTCLVEARQMLHRPGANDGEAVIATAKKFFDFVKG